MTSHDRLRVLALTAFPTQAASTRFRLMQLLPHLSESGIDVTVRPFLDSATYGTLYDRNKTAQTAMGLVRCASRRILDLLRTRQADVLLVLREAMIAGPPLIELLASSLGRCPLVLDLDDPTWVAYDSPTYGRLGHLLKWPGKALTLIDRADAVTCANRHIARFVVSRGRRAALLPIVVDTDLFRPRPPHPNGAMPVVGWVGSHSTFPYLNPLIPALAAAAEAHPFRLRIIGAGTSRLDLHGFPVEYLDWDLLRESTDFAAFDIGLYPLPEGDPWAMGKSALKSVQYMASGVPFVASPVGAAAEVGVDGSTHILADSTQSWTRAIATLLDDAPLRARMGQAGRLNALQHHTTAIGATLLRDVLRGVQV